MPTPFASRRYAAFVLALVVLFGIAAVLVGQALGPRWTAQATVSYSSVSDDRLLFDNGNATLIERELADAAALAVSQAVLEPASELIAGGLDWPALQAAITVEPQTGSNIMLIKASASDRASAARRVGAVTTSFQNVSRQRIIESARATAEAADRSADQASAARAAPLRDIAARADVVASTATPVTVLSTGTPVKTRPTPLRDAATGLVLGLLAAAALLVVRRVRPARVSGPQDVVEMLGLPCADLTSEDVSASSQALLADVRRLAERASTRRLVVVPAGAASLQGAQDVADYFERQPQDASAHVHARGEAEPTGPTAGPLAVVVTAAPSTTVVGPAVDGAGAVLLVVGAGESSGQVRANHRVSQQWQHPPDAAVVVA